MKQLATRKLFQYWKSLQEDETLPPDRVAFQPGMVAELMPFLFIVENSPTAMHGIMRLAGGGLSNIYDRELTGTNFFDLWRREDQALIDEVLLGLRSGTDGVVISTSAEHDGRQIVSEFLLLPLAHPEGRKVLGVQALEDKTLVSKVDRQFGESNFLHGAGVNTVITKKRPHVEPVFGLADVFSKATEANVIEFARRGRVPADAKKVGHLSVIDGGMG